MLYKKRSLLKTINAKTRTYEKKQKIIKKNPDVNLILSKRQRNTLDK